MTNSRAFFLASMGTLFLLAACAGNHASPSGAGAGTGVGGASPGDCEATCTSIAMSCGMDPSQCAPVCAMGLSPATLACIQNAGCDYAAAGECIKSAASSSSGPTGSSSSTTGSGSTATSTGSAAASSSSGSTCTPTGSSCDPNAMTTTCCVEECYGGTCCLGPGSPHLCFSDDDCCSGLSCVNMVCQ